MSWSNKNLVNILSVGGVAVMPTDTLYGIVGSALNQDTVERIYEVRKRNPRKPCIILIGSENELQTFSINLSEKQKESLKAYWSSGAVSVVLDCTDERFFYLHRGTQTLAFRMPLAQELRDLLIKTGPLIAPSANTEATPPLAPSTNIDQAKGYFGDRVDLYVDGGELAGKASKIIKLHKDGSANVLRE